MFQGPCDSCICARAGLAVQVMAMGRQSCGYFLTHEGLSLICEYFISECHSVAPSPPAASTACDSRSPLHISMISLMYCGYFVVVRYSVGEQCEEVGCESPENRPTAETFRPSRFADYMGGA